MANNTTTTTTSNTTGLVWASACDGSLIVAKSVDELRKKLAKYAAEYRSAQ